MLPRNGYRFLNITESDSIQWMPIKGFESRYELSSTGDVRILATGKLLAKRVIGNHESVVLYDGSMYKGYTIAKLLQSHFGLHRKLIAQVSDLEGEEWRVIPDFEGLYWISNKCRIKSRNAGVRDKELLVKATNHVKGGYSVSLHKNYLIITSQRTRLPSNTSQAYNNQLPKFPPPSYLGPCSPPSIKDRGTTHGR